MEVKQGIVRDPVPSRTYSYKYVIHSFIPCARCWCQWRGVEDTHWSKALW